MAPKRAAATKAGVDTAESTTSKVKQTATAKTSNKKTTPAKTTAKNASSQSSTEDASAPKRGAASKKVAAPKKAAASKKVAAPKKAAAPKKTAASKKAAVSSPTETDATAPEKRVVKETAIASQASADDASAPKKRATSSKKTSFEKKAKAPDATRSVEATSVAKKIAPKKAATKSNASTPINGVKLPSSTSRKRKRDAVVSQEFAKESQEDDAPKPSKRARTAAADAAPKKVAAPKIKIGKKINSAPTEPLEIFVFGEGTSGELGLGSVRVGNKKPIDVKRPRLNPNLEGVVEMACGGMHSVALTKDNKIITWGVNDQGALGRDTTWDGGLKEMDADSDSEDEDDTGLNPRESNAAEIDMTHVAEGTKFVQLAASDSASFALTEDGKVYGWGTFRNNEGVIGFIQGREQTERVPVMLPYLSKITKICAGANHVLAMDEKFKVVSWGAGQQGQLARKLVERDQGASLRPQGIGALPKRAKAAQIACGSYHSMVVDNMGRVFAFGLNNYGEVCLPGAGEDNSSHVKPTLVEKLAGYNITHIDGGEHHSLACTDDGKLLVWGRVDNHQLGIPREKLNRENTMYDEFDKPRILSTPMVVEGLPPIVHVAAGTDHNVVISKDGKAYSWGFSANYQTGQGTDEDVELPTLMDNTAVREKHLVWSGAGGQYAMVAAKAS